MPRNNEAYTKRCDFSRYALEVFLLLFLFFILPHAALGIINDVETSNPSPSPSSPPSNQASILNHNEPHFLPNRTVIVELFEWKFIDVKAECTNFLGPKGYAGVQLSPVTEHLVDDGAQVQVEQSWMLRYQPVSYKFASRSGSVEDFLAMSQACNAAGVRVYVDVVLNHMAGISNSTLSDDNDLLLLGTAGSVANYTALNYSSVPFDASDFHETCVLENYFDAHEVRNCQLNGQPDLNHSRVDVQERILEFLNRLIGMGVAGFRIDSAKYMWPNELKVIYEAVNDLNSKEFDFKENSRPIFFQEIVDLGVDAISKTDYISIGFVTEYLYAAELSTIFRGEVPLSSLINWGPAMGFLPHQNALVFVDTHESQNGYLVRELGKNQLISYKEQRLYIMVTSFMLAHPYGHIKRILSSYHFQTNTVAGEQQREYNNSNSEDSQHSPNSQQKTTNTIARDTEIDEQCKPTNFWICEHRWPAVVNMLALANVLSASEDGVIDFQTYSPNHIAFCRGQKAFIAINNDKSLEYSTTVHTCLEPGVYCDIISGGRNENSNDCIGKRIVVKENGMADLLLPVMSATRNIAVDIDNIDAGAGSGNGSDSGNGNGIGSTDDGASVIYDAANWKGADADVNVDYGVIAIYIGSKLVNSEMAERAQNSEVIEQSKEESALVSEKEGSENGAGQLDFEKIDDNSTVDTMHDKLATEINETKAEEKDVKTNATLCNMTASIYNGHDET